MTHKKNETLAVGWCDNGSTDGRFTEGLMLTTLGGLLPDGVTIHTAMRVAGNQIGRQRQILFDMWADEEPFQTDWLLWIDSDIFITQEELKKVWDAADAKERPVVTGTYFVSKDGEQPLMTPMPALFLEGRSDEELAWVHPLPVNALVKVHAAGFGFMLMHRSIIEPIRKAAGKDALFYEKQEVGKQFIGEDIVFCKKLAKAEIPLYAHTGALVQHIKRYPIDEHYYSMFWYAMESKGIQHESR